jgi:hypothetical protein
MPHRDVIGLLGVRGYTNPDDLVVGTLGAVFLRKDPSVQARGFDVKSEQLGGDALLLYLSKILGFSEDELIVVHPRLLVHRGAGEFLQLVEEVHEVYYALREKRKPRNSGGKTAIF